MTNENLILVYDLDIMYSLLMIAFLVSTIFSKGNILYHYISDVQLEKIESFGRIAEMNCPKSLLIKSITFLSDLELNSDRTRVRRKTPLNYDYSADDRTIYIVSLVEKN